MSLVNFFNQRICFYSFERDGKKRERERNRLPPILAHLGMEPATFFVVWDDILTN